MRGGVTSRSSIKSSGESSWGEYGLGLGLCGVRLGLGLELCGVSVGAAVSRTLGGHIYYTLYIYIVF